MGKPGFATIKCLYLEDQLSKEIFQLKRGIHLHIIDQVTRPRDDERFNDRLNKNSLNKSSVENDHTMQNYDTNMDNNKGDLADINKESDTKKVILSSFQDIDLN